MIKKIVTILFKLYFIGVIANFAMVTPIWMYNAQINGWNEDKGIIQMKWILFTSWFGFWLVVIINFMKKK